MDQTKIEILGKFNVSRKDYPNNGSCKLLQVDFLIMKDTEWKLLAV